METVKRYYRIDRREICFFHWIIEGYDGIATVTTLDPEKGHLRVAAAPGAEDILDLIVEDLKTGGLLIECADSNCSRQDRPPVNRRPYERHP